MSNYNYMTIIRELRSHAQTAIQNRLIITETSVRLIPDWGEGPYPEEIYSLPTVLIPDEAAEGEAAEAYIHTIQQEDGIVYAIAVDPWVDEEYVIPVGELGAIATFEVADLLGL